MFITFYSSYEKNKYLMKILNFLNKKKIPVFSSIVYKFKNKIINFEKKK